MSLCLRALAAIALVFTGPAAHAADPGETLSGTFVVGDAIPLEAAEAPHLSRLAFGFERCGPMMRSRWHDPRGQLMAAEELESDGTGLRRYRYWRPNIEESATVTRTASSLHIEVNRKGRREQKHIPALNGLSAGPMLILLAQTELERLERGTPITVNYLVARRFSIYAFKLAGEKDSGKRVVDVSAESWLVRKVAGPFKMYFNAAGELEGLRGRVLPVSGIKAHDDPMLLHVQVSRRFERACSAKPVAGLDDFLNSPP